MRAIPFTSQYRKLARCGLLRPVTAFALLCTSHALFGQVSETEMQALESRLPASAETRIDFDAHVRPILENSCLRCHGPERPKGRFRLDSRENALKGGEHGVDIIPGKSSRSPLIYYVARLVEDMEMPPPGKIDPLTAEQVALLRAWIDQGVSWSASQTNASKITFSVTPGIQWFAVSGDERKFREHMGIKEGWNGGAQSLFLQQQLRPDRRLTLEGRMLANPEEYKLKLELEQRDLGFVRFGFEQYREYYDDTGGFHSFTPPSFNLGRDLHLDIGRAWVDLGLTLPDWPRMVIGYEFQYRDGAKSILEWGDVGSNTFEPEFTADTTDAKKIMPAFRQIDEQVHVFKFDLTHDVNGLGIENSFRADLYENRTERNTTGFRDLSGFNQNSEVLTREDHDHFQASDSIRLEKQVRDWLFLSGGYFFSTLEGQYGFGMQTSYPDGEYITRERRYFTDSIILEQDSHVFNANTQLGPWGGLTVYAGVQNEWMSQHGFGTLSFYEGIPESFLPVPVTLLPVMLDSNLDRAVVEEHFGARYTQIPFTVLFVEGRFAQESIDQTEARTGSAQDFLRDTDASSNLAEGRIGFTVSPWTRLSLTSHYKRRNKDSDYDHLRDIDLARDSEGYSAFITGREVATDEFSSKLSIRPVNWVKLGVTYQLIATDYETTTQPILRGGPEDTPGGPILAGNFDAHVYGLTAALSPWHRLHVSSAFNLRQSRISTAHNLSPVIVDYEGDVYSSISRATVILNNKTDLTLGYTYSWADYGQDNFDRGLPLGIVYDWHMVSAGITRAWKKNLSTNLQYRFYSYDEENTGGFNNYTAHGILASLTMRIE
jgi:hypothetical protein